MKRMLLVLCYGILGASLGYAQIPLNDPQLYALSLAESDVQAAEDSAPSAMDISLVEPLNSLADQQMALGYYDQAHRSLDRIVQIIRINEGLFTQTQYLYQNKKVQNLVNAGRWDEGRGQLEHLLWLYLQKTKIATPELVDNFSELAQFHLSGISEDSAEYQAFHVRRAMQSRRVALAVATVLFGEDSPAIVPFIYEMVSQLHLESVAIDKRGPLSRELRAVAVGSDYLRDVSEMQQYYFGFGYQLLSQIKAIYQGLGFPNLEAMAMADLYLADWLSLFDQHESALLAYKAAHQALSDTSADPKTLADYFNAPRLIPESEFYPSLNLAAAKAGSVEAGSAAEVAANAIATPLNTALDASSAEITAQTMSELFFTEWSPSFPHLQQPAVLDQTLLAEPKIAIFSFNIGGSPDLQRLLRGRRPIGFGVVEDLSLQSGPSLGVRDQRDLVNRVSALRFRPKLVEGVPQESSVQLVYSFLTLP